MKLGAFSGDRIEATPWYRPLSFTGYLNKTATELSETGDLDGALVLAHENLHYIQSISTVSSIRPFLVYWQTHAAFSDLLSSDVNNEAATKVMKQRYAQYVDEMAFWNGEPYQDIQSPISYGAHLVEFGNENIIAAFAKPISPDTNRLFFFTRTALQESMALAYEAWISSKFNRIDEAISSPDWYVFQYGMGWESVKHITGWNDHDTITWVTIACIDYALDHPLSGRVFVRAIYEVSQKWRNPPSIDLLPELYQLLSNKYDDESRVGFRTEVRKILEDYISKHEEDAVLFDKAFISLAKAMHYAMYTRADQPFLIVQKLLLDSQDPWFIEHFQMPMYYTGSDLIDVGVGRDNFFGALFLEIAFHRLHTFMEPDSMPCECPLLNKPNCHFERNDNCSSSPWKQKRWVTDPKNVCVYEYVEQTYHR